MATQTNPQCQAIDLARMGRSGPTRQNQRDQGHAGVSGGEARHPHATKQDRKPKKRDQTTAGLLTKSQRHEGKATQSIQQSKKRPREPQRPVPSKPSPPQPTRRRHGTQLDIPFCAGMRCVGVLTTRHRDQGKATQSIQLSKNTETKIGKGTKARHALATLPN